MIKLKFILLVIALFLSGCSATASALTCKNGGTGAMKGYQRALDLIRGGGRLTVKDEAEILRLLDLAVENKCEHAALVLVDIKANQAAAAATVDKNKNAKLIEKLDKEQYELLSEALKLGEGHFEFGNFFLTNTSKYYNPERARELLEQGAKKGNIDCIKFLVDAYQNGVGGIPIDKKRAEYWSAVEARMRRDAVTH